MVKRSLLAILLLTTGSVMPINATNDGSGKPIGIVDLSEGDYLWVLSILYKVEGVESGRMTYYAVFEEKNGFVVAMGHRKEEPPCRYYFVSRDGKFYDVKKLKITWMDKAVSYQGKVFNSVKLGKIGPEEVR